MQHLRAARLAKREAKEEEEPEEQYLPKEPVARVDIQQPEKENSSDSDSETAGIEEQ